MPLNLRILFGTIGLIASGFCLGASPRPAAIDAYAAELAKVEQASAPVSLEPLFAAAEQAQDALMLIQDGDRAWLDVLTESEYAALKVELRGLKLSRGFDTYAQPDGQFLFRLAKAHGRAEDRAFFRLYSRFWTAEQLPQYLSMGKTTTPCVRFGSSIVTNLYASWAAFASSYPQAYPAFTKQTLQDLEEAVALGVCACGNEASVSRELKGFLKRFPQTAVATQIGTRLRELKDNPNLHPVHCR